MKTCGDCYQLLPLDAFYPRKCGHKGRSTYCRVCTLARQRWYDAKRRKQQRAR